MKTVIKGAVVGGVIGLVAPAALAVANEFLLSRNTGGTIEPQICFAERLWNLQRIQVKHAPGCKNKILESTPQVFLLSILAGSAGGGGLGLSLLASKSTGRKRTTQIPGLKDEKDESMVPEEPKQEVVAQEPVVETNKNIELEGFDLEFVAKSVVVGSIIAGIGFATIKALENSPGAFQNSPGNNGAGFNPIQSEPKEITTVTVSMDPGPVDWCGKGQLTQVGLRRRFLEKGWIVTSQSSFTSQYTHSTGHVEDCNYINYTLER